MLRVKTKQLLRDEHGSVTMLVAGLMMALVVVAALAVDSGHLYAEETLLEASADSAALAAIVAISNGGDEQDAEDAAIAYAERNMPVGEYGNVLRPEDVVWGEWDWDARTFTAGGNANAVRVTLRRTAANGNPVDTFLGALMGYQQMNITVQATASMGGGSPGCILALDPGSTGQSLKFNSMGSADVRPCVPAANSTAGDAIKVSSIDSFRAGSLYAVGHVDIASYLESGLDEPPQEDQDPASDPYGSLPDPSFGGCDYTNHNASSSISPGVYCGGLNASSSSLTVEPGTYYIVDGDLIIESMNSVTCNCAAPGSGVTFVLTGTTPAQIGTFSINSIGTLSLQAPSDGSYDYPGMLIYVDRRAPYADSTYNQIDNLTFNGAIYAPSQNLMINSIDYTVQTDCMWIVGYNIDFNSMDSFGRTDNCGAYGTRTISIGGGGGGNSNRVARLVQ